MNNPDGTCAHEVFRFNIIWEDDEIVAGRICCGCGELLNTGQQKLQLTPEMRALLDTPLLP